ncbi:MAG: hypothetical protein PHE15_07020 [Dehalococcoidales bacterium]|nr:hypothetical protein [Dehalococcoidales bacterium]
MSRLIDKLKQASQSEPPPMGFRMVQKNCKPRLLIITRLNQSEIGNVSDIADASDAFLFTIQKLAELKAVEKIIKAMSDTPCGCLIDGNISIHQKQIEQSGLDFLFFTEDLVSTELIKSEKTGKILVADESLGNDMIRVLDTMPEDAIFLDCKPEDKFSLTWQKLMMLKRFSMLSSKPLLVSVPMDLTADELQVIWEMGVDGLVVDIADAESIGILKDLHKIVEGLTHPSKRKHGKSRAIVPAIQSEAPAVVDDDDGEEDEYFHNS